MSADNELDRRTVLKSGGAALGGLGALGTVVSPAQARCNTVGGDLNFYGAEFEFEATFCDCEADIDVTIVGQSDDLTLTCSGATRTIEFNVGAAYGTIELEADFDSQCLEVTIDASIWKFTGWVDVYESARFCN